MNCKKREYQVEIPKSRKPAFVGLVLLFLLLMIAGRAAALRPAYIDDINLKLLSAIYENNPDSVRSLLEQGANVNSRDYGGTTALMFSMYSDGGEIIEILLEHGADLNSIDYAGMSVLMHALLAGRKDFIYKHLDEFGAINHANEHGYTAIIFASQDDDIDLVLALVDIGANIHYQTNKGTTALMHAVSFGNFFVADYLLSIGANVNHQAGDGSTALHLAAWYGHSELSGLLIDWWADPEIQDDAGNTPLMVAVYGRQLATAWYLLESGALAETVNRAGLSPLSIASVNDDLEMIELIMAYMGAEILEENKRRSALALAMFGRNQPLAGKLKSHEYIKPRGLYFSEMQLTQGFDFNGDDNLYHSSLSLYEARYQLHLRLQYFLRTGYQSLLVPQDNNFFYQFHEKRSVVSLGLYREVIFWRVSPNTRFGIMPGLEMAYSSAHYRGTGIDAPKGVKLIPATELFVHYRNFTLYGGYSYFDTGQQAISAHRYRIGVGYRFQLFRTSPLRYRPILN